MPFHLFVTISTPNRPDRMYRNSRALDNDFAADELLYRRFSKNEVAEGRLLPSAIDFPDWSINRQKYSEPGDVRFPAGCEEIYFCCGVVGFKVSDIPTSLTIETTPAVFTFDVQHRPEDDNYSHSEVWTYKDGYHSSDKKFKKKINTMLKKKFRQILSDRTYVIEDCQPNICFRSQISC